LAGRKQSLASHMSQQFRD